MEEGHEDGQNTEDYDDDSDYYKDGYYKDGLYYERDPSLVRVTKELAATQATLEQQQRLTAKMKETIEQLQNKFNGLTWTDGEPSVEEMTEGSVAAVGREIREVQERKGEATRG
uniref:Uncharacterized protein n=1 Tax=Cannabis sativa TaxID=3483 RepID=A0A803NL13_CANSA